MMNAYIIPLHTSSDETRIEAAVQNLAQAIHDRDVEATVACYATKNIMYTLAPPLLSDSMRGSPGKAGVEAWFATFESPIVYETRDLEVVVSGDVAFTYGLKYFSATKVGGEKSDFWFRETLGFRKLNGEWKIIHQHQSVPFYMDGSNRAALDLKPE